MSLVLYGHSFSSYTQKVRIALYENDIPHEFRELGPDAPQYVAEWLQRWPIGKFPLLVDNGRSVVETSIIIEYLQLVYPGPVRLLPSDPMSAPRRSFSRSLLRSARHELGTARGWGCVDG